MPEENLPDPPASVGDLQFRQAEFAEEPPKLSCAACQAAISGEYYQLGGVPVCGTCAQQWRALQQGPSQAELTRGALFASGAAIAGAVGMAVIASVTGFQFSIAAIGVGWLVGKAMRLGTNGFGSRHCQILSVALAYLGITLSSLPTLAKALSRDGTSGLSVTLIALAAPFLELAGGINGILRLLILFFGLSQAWRMTGPDKRSLTGPHSTEPAEG